MDITPQLIASHGLTGEEYQRIEQILGRAPNYTELGIFSVMWSEHCSYKSSARAPAQVPDHRGRAWCRGRARTRA